MRTTAFLLLLWCSHAWAAEPAPARRYVVSELGAVGDGATLNTAALQTAIDRCAADGGGVVVVPKGVFLTGALFFKQGVNLHVEQDGVLKGTTSTADYPPIYTRWEGIERYWSSALLNFVGMTGVEVTGAGTIDGSGDAWPSARGQGRGPGAPTAGAPEAGPPGRGTQAQAPTLAPARPTSLPAETVAPTLAKLSLAPDPANLPRVNAAGVALPGGGQGRPRLMVFQECKEVRVSGLQIKNEASWGVVFIYCEDAVAENLTIRAEHFIPSSDGMDIDSSRRVRITGCDIDCNDDCISLKAGKDEDGRRVNRPCEDILIEKTRFAYGHGGAAMGSETAGGIRNVEVRDCVAEAGNWAPIRFKSQPTRGGVVENITYRNFQLNGTRQAMEFNLEWNMRINNTGTRVVPAVRNVRLINVTGSVSSVGVIHGLEDSWIDGVTFEGCRLEAATGLRLENVQNVDLSGLYLTVEEWPLLRRNANTADIRIPPQPATLPPEALQ